MRKINDILREFRDRPLGYWLGLNPRCSFELRERSIMKRVGESVSEFTPIANIVSWKLMGHREVAIRFSDHITIAFDTSGTLRSILQRVVGEKEDKNGVAEG